MFVTEIVRKLKRDDLVWTARELGISVSLNFRKAEILELIEHALKEKKPDEKPILPPGFIKKTCVRLMPKNPLWGFAYWNTDAEELKAVVSGLALYSEKIRKRIRIFNLASNSDPSLENARFFDQDVSESSNSGYIRLGGQGVQYYLELGLYITTSCIPGKNRFIPLCRSNIIEPGGASHLSDRECEKWIVPCGSVRGYKEVQPAVFECREEGSSIVSGGEKEFPPCKASYSSPSFWHGDGEDIGHM